MSKRTIASGVRTDFDILLHEFTKTESVRYEHFAEVWRRLKVPLIFCGRTSQRELTEFTEDCFKIGLKLWMPPHSFHERVGALYLLYGLYTTQLLSPKAKIRITPVQWRDLLLFQSEVETEQHYDACYILRWLKSNAAFQFVATPATLFPGVPGHSDDMGAEERALHTDQTKGSSVVSLLIQSSIIDELSSIHDQYYTMKCALNNNQEPHSSMKVIHPDLVQTITKSVASYEEWRKTGKKVKRKRNASGMTSESDGDSEVEHVVVTRSQGNIRTSIRDRAFSQKPVRKGSRHRRQPEENVASTSLNVASTSLNEHSPNKRRRSKKKGRRRNTSTGSESDILSPKGKKLTSPHTSERRGGKRKCNADVNTQSDTNTNSLLVVQEERFKANAPEETGLTPGIMRNILLDMPSFEQQEGEKKGKKQKTTAAKEKKKAIKQKTLPMGKPKSGSSQDQKKDKRSNKDNKKRKKRK